MSYTEPFLQGGLTAPGGGYACWELSIPSHSKIKKVIVEQTGGDGVEFAVDIFTLNAACELESISDSLGDQRGRLTPSLYKAMPTLFSTDSLAELFIANDGYGFEGKSPGVNGDMALHRRRAWLRISPNGTGEKTFCACIGVDLGNIDV